MSEKNKIKPLFKYIGGKSWLRENLRNSITEVLESASISMIKSYQEPFTGGLGSFLNVYDILLKNNIMKVTLSDINENLINTYKLIQKNPYLLINEFIILEKEFVEANDNEWKNKKTKEEIKNSLTGGSLFFNKVKKDFNLNKNFCDEKQSARLVFLQKHSFNGVYRENLKGEYNTPFNWSGSHMLDTIEDRVLEINKLFNCFDLTFEVKSFEDVDYNISTLYYLDPPYINEDIAENKYNKDVFDVTKQLLLIDKIKHCSFIYSNHKSKILLENFNSIKGIKIQEVMRKNIMSANAEKRKEDKIELLVLKK